MADQCKPPAHGHIAVIAALAAERECLDSNPRASQRSRVVVYQSGPGAERARTVAERALTCGAAGLVAWGFSGALARRLRAGAVLVPARIVVPGRQSIAVDAPWRDAVVSGIGKAFAASSDDLLTAAAVLKTAQQKERAGSESGAIAVDMESAAIVQAARDAAVPCVVVRVIIDTLGDTLPARAEQWIDAAGNRHLRPAIAAALDPFEWRRLLTLARRYHAARHSLRSLAQRLLPSDFFFPRPL
jgi:adenosylhomocysteine nucleosidase